MNTIVHVPNVIAIATAKNSTEFAPVAAPVIGVVCEDGCACGLLHEFAVSEWLVAFVREAPLPTPPQRLAGQPLYRHTADALAGLRQQHRDHCREMGIGPPATPDTNRDPLTGEDDEDRRRKGRPQHFDTPERIEL